MCLEGKVLGRQHKPLLVEEYGKRALPKVSRTRRDSCLHTKPQAREERSDVTLRFADEYSFVGI